MAPLLHSHHAMPTSGITHESPTNLSCLPFRWSVNMSFTTMRTNRVVPAQRDGPLSAALPRLLPVRLRIVEPQALHPRRQVWNKSVATQISRINGQCTYYLLYDLYPRNALSNSLWRTGRRYPPSRSWPTSNRSCSKVSWSVGWHPLAISCGWAIMIFMMLPSSLALDHFLLKYETQLLTAYSMVPLCT